MQSLRKTGDPGQRRKDYCTEEFCLLVVELLWERARLQGKVLVISRLTQCRVHCFRGRHSSDSSRAAPKMLGQTEFVQYVPCTQHPKNPTLSFKTHPGWLKYPFQDRWKVQVTPRDICKF